MVITGNHIEFIQNNQVNLEICLFSEFVESQTADDLLTQQQINHLHRFNFYVWLWVTEGKCYHQLDFQTVTQLPGEWLLIEPRQVHHFLSITGWDGWGLAFPAEWISPNLTSKWHSLPKKQRISAQEQPLLELAMQQLKHCRYFEWSEKNSVALIQAQLHSFILLLMTLYTQSEIPLKGIAQRWQQFNHLLEQHFTQQHQVQFYAMALACSEKTLNSTCLHYTGLAIKTVINQRILLEAKRLLIHTTMAVKQISLQLGFEDTSYFNKFFKKYEQATPKQFREHYLNSRTD
ncbi:AraC family transcriptional regulator [Rodentibacter caecimuris]|uniref:AraC family transcriptional regulator n=1 Tax=Rodentibacter caecimuris TaxID=1796644 RepID=A0A1V3KJU9_9PAST|nr:helix-turn-helix domain-containing protein [Rodentibacter heylii]OOF77941.1 AraC family transcriptional regulator [Rodentibacter heylii]